MTGISPLATAAYELRGQSPKYSLPASGTPKVFFTLDLSVEASDGAGISWLHRNAGLHDDRFDITVRVDSFS
jgi:hypothetical protein